MCRVTFDLKKELKSSDKYYENKRTLGPTWACLEITSYCNFDCDYCVQENSNINDLCFEEWCIIIDKLKSFGITQISIIGGEPTLSSDLFEIIRYAKKQGFVVSLCSNGSLVDNSYAQALSASGLDQIQINIDHIDKGHHKNIRKSPSCCVEPLTALRNCSEYGIETVVATVVQEGNFNCLEEISSLVVENNFSSYRLWREVSGAPSAEMADFIVAAERVHAYLRERGLVSVKSTCNDLPVSFSDEISFSGCPAGSVFICISSFGDVFPCSFCRTSVGNILKEPLEAIFGNVAELSRQEKDLCLL
ncbi:radical SAM/SPASM domain-containing protein [Desulfuromonas sp. TF]|uniref:radical SAM/SPASM domain-containing protein n=1 Tax=Desulfuromonas sp. TF TaxID=1232410 RepID=UPI0004090C8A|nr:radical SAM protein [Desulfuromonas sp. TF]